MATAVPPPLAGVRVLAVLQLADLVTTEQLEEVGAA
jgi:hypothetical protein